MFWIVFSIRKLTLMNNIGAIALNVPQMQKKYHYWLKLKFLLEENRYSLAV
ncbi:hypothetical protein SAMN05444483_104156 [Salegentibacter echinorum]|uniref:Uncharacterized protein n=1 Tax=Salegentibacter echinorum TaxID=1073325 RepID=A0A1M5GGQ6_SALEC|nr:hypothetical protein SAMN05444483_104156 [Salegentibacter echinorum]